MKTFIHVGEARDTWCARVWSAWFARLSRKFQFGEATVIEFRPLSCADYRKTENLWKLCWSFYGSFGVERAENSLRCGLRSASCDSLICTRMSISPTKGLSMEGVVDVEAPAISSELGDLGLDSSKEAGDGSSSQSGTTPEALFYVLPYLGLKEVLTLEAVSKQLREAIRGDVTLWQQLHVDVPLNRKLTNAELIRLSSRSHFRLQSLSLIKCTRISERVIEDIVRANPLLQKLNLSGCTGVSVEAVLRVVTMQTERRSPNVPGLTQLRIRGLYGVTPEILDSLLTMMRPEGDQASSDMIPSPQYYKNGEPSPAITEERLIDIEACPKCRKAGLVFDCTRPTCQKRRNIPLQQCRGCYLCIARCEECGTCIDGDDYEETFCMEILCQSCWLRLPKCSECNRAGCSRHVEALHISENSIFSCDSCQGILLGETGPIFD